MDFCKYTYNILTPITHGQTLLFKSDKSGTVYEALPENTLLASENTSELDSIYKFTNTLSVAAYSSINARERLAEGCPKCKRKVVSFQRLGEEQKVIFVCLCGHNFSP